MKDFTGMPIVGKTIKDLPENFTWDDVFTIGIGIPIGTQVFLKTYFQPPHLKSSPQPGYTKEQMGEAYDEGLSITGTDTALLSVSTAYGGYAELKQTYLNSLPPAKDAGILVEALRKVAEWKLPETGRFWDDDKTRPLSYEAAYGSNGAREFIRGIARAALTQYNNPPQPGNTQP